MLSTWEYQGTFFDGLAPTSRNMVTQLFLKAIRSGIKDARDVVEQVGADCIDAMANGEEWDSFPADEICILLRKVESIDDPIANELATFLIERDALPSDQKARLKAAYSFSAAGSVMAKSEPTEKQLSYLKSLGCKDTPSSKLEASQWIDKLVKEKVQAA